MRRPVSLLFLSLCVPLAAPGALLASGFQSAWTAEADRVWLGADYWANPLQDWRLRGGRAECHVSGGDRNLYLLTLALVCHAGEVRPSPATPELMADFGQRPGTARGGAFRFWFAGWKASGARLEAHPERAFGPILFALHTLSHRVLKLTAQLAPVDDPTASVALEVAGAGEPGSWRRLATAGVDPLARTEPAP